MLDAVTHAARCRGTWYDITTWAARTHNCDNHPESVACMACSQVSRHHVCNMVHHANYLYIAGLRTRTCLCFPLQNMPPFTKQTGVVPIGASAATCCNMHMIALLRSGNSPWRNVSTARPPHPKLTSRMFVATAVGAELFAYPEKGATCSMCLRYCYGAVTAAFASTQICNALKVPRL